MIRDILDFASGAELRGDVAVVGSGLAGVEAARRLAANGLSVIVLESGRRDFDPAIQALNDVQHAGKPHRIYGVDADFHRHLPPHYRGLNRIRQFGGTSNSWTGKWRAFTQADLAARPWIPESGWPIGIEDLAPMYAAVAEEYGLGDVIAEAASPAFQAADAGLRSAGLTLAVHYWEDRTTRVGDRFEEELRASSAIDVILGATVTEIVLDDSLERARLLRCRSLEGRELTVRADWIVLATGGLEVPRLLLASNRQVSPGIGNQHDVVGRYYIEHPKEQAGRLVPAPRIAKLAPRLQSRPRPRFCLSFALSDEVIGRHQILRHSIYLTPRYERLRDKPMRALRRRPACRDERGVVRHYRVKFATEQVPQRDSRVYLGQRRDALGMPELVVDWRFTDLDRRSIQLASRQAKAAFAAAGLGELRFGAEPLTLEATMDAAHPMGTARMSDDPRRGVVDRNCRVHGTQNLFIASSAVFPTGAIYSPTYTILALARRVGEHISRQQASRAATT